MTDSPTPNTTPTPMPAPMSDKQRRKARIQFILLALMFASPVIIGTFMYFFAPPSGTTNYGELVSPQLSLPELSGTLHDGEPLPARPWKGQWWMVSFDTAACEEACATKLFVMRQLRLTQGKDADRIERVMFVTDDAPVNPKVLEAYPGTYFVRANNTSWKKKFELANVSANPTKEAKEHIFFVDPMGNLMMRYAAKPDPNKMKKDLAKLLKLSSGWQSAGSKKQ